MSIKEKCGQLKIKTQSKLNEAIEKLLVKDGETTNSFGKLLLALPLKAVLLTINFFDYTKRKIVPFVADKCLSKVKE